MPLLRSKYGKDNVIGSDISQPSEDFINQGPFTYLDVTNHQKTKDIIKEFDVDWIIHNASLLSAAGEKNPQLAMQVNIRGFENILEIAKNKELRLLSPSSIAAFGPSTPKLNTPDFTVMRPTTIYGISKVYVELLGEYYHTKWNTDFRSLRYPGIISNKTMPVGGTTDYAVEIFYEALKHKSYTCFLEPTTTLPMMYMDDCLTGTIQLLEADEQQLNQRTYNLAAISFNPQQLADGIKSYIPDFVIKYLPDFRQSIAETWPQSLDDTHARKDWNWQHQFNLEKLVSIMLSSLSEKLEIPLVIN